MVSLREIKAVARRVAKKARPERIVLFGSYANGNPTPDSDVDLLVVMEFEGKSWRKAADLREIANAPFPMDLLVRAPRQLQQALNESDSFAREILQNGVVLYEA